MRRLIDRVQGRLIETWLLLRLLPRATQQLIRLGSDYGGWWVPAAAIRPGVVCVCLGAGEDISFDIELCERGATVITADPTPRAIEHVRSVTVSGDFVFLPVGVAGVSGVRKFYVPRDPQHVSHSITNLQGTDDFFEAECLSMADLMQRAGVSQIDLLKLDVEGAEHESIQAMLEAHVYPEVVCVEFDQPAPLRRMAATIRRLQDAGYRALKVERFNVTFARAA